MNLQRQRYLQLLIQNSKDRLENPVSICDNKDRNRRKRRTSHQGFDGVNPIIGEVATEEKEEKEKEDTDSVSSEFIPDPSQINMPAAKKKTTNTTPIRGSKASPSPIKSTGSSMKRTNNGYQQPKKQNKIIESDEEEEDIKGDNFGYFTEEEPLAADSASKKNSAKEVSANGKFNLSAKQIQPSPSSSSSSKFKSIPSSGAFHSPVKSGKRSNSPIDLIESSPETIPKKSMKSQIAEPKITSPLPSIKKEKPEPELYFYEDDDIIDISDSSSSSSSSSDENDKDEDKEKKIISNELAPMELSIDDSTNLSADKNSVQGNQEKTSNEVIEEEPNEYADYVDPSSFDDYIETMDPLQTEEEVEQEEIKRVFPTREEEPKEIEFQAEIDFQVSESPRRMEIESSKKIEEKISREQTSEVLPVLPSVVNLENRKRKSCKDERQQKRLERLRKRSERRRNKPNSSFNILEKEKSKLLEIGYFNITLKDFDVEFDPVKNEISSVNQLNDLMPFETAPVLSLPANPSENCEADINANHEELPLDDKIEISSEITLPLTEIETPMIELSEPVIEIGGVDFMEDVIETSRQDSEVSVAAQNSESVPQNSLLANLQSILGAKEVLPVKEVEKSQSNSSFGKSQVPSYEKLPSNAQSSSGQESRFKPNRDLPLSTELHKDSRSPRSGNPHNSNPYDYSRSSTNRNDKYDPYSPREYSMRENISKDYPSRNYPSSRDYPSRDYPYRDYPSRDYSARDNSPRSHYHNPSDSRSTSSRYEDNRKYYPDGWARSSADTYRSSDHNYPERMSSYDSNDSRRRSRSRSPNRNRSREELAQIQKGRADYDEWLRKRAEQKEREEMEAKRAKNKELEKYLGPESDNEKD